MNDFAKFAAEIGLTPEQLAQAQCGWMTWPDDSYFLFKESPIHGIGAFKIHNSTAEIRHYMARLGAEWTTLGRFTNHSAEPNSVAVLIGSDLYFKTLHRLVAGEELTVDYRGVKAALFHNHVQ